MKKPPDKSVFGIGPKKKPSAPPPSFKSASDKPDAEPDPDDPNEDAEMAAGEPPETPNPGDELGAGGAAGGGPDTGSDLTPEMMNYHGGDTTCGSCMHMVGETQCDRWPDPIDSGGWCLGYQSGGGTDTGGGADALAALMGGPPGGGGPPMGGGPGQ